MKSGIALYGGFSAIETLRDERDWSLNETILDAIGLNRRVVTVDDSVGVTIDGFIIRNGQATGISPYGGGLYFRNVASATLQNCSVVGNRATLPPIPILGQGGGVHCEGSSPAIRNCIIASNSALLNGGGISCHASAAPEITNCTITGNLASTGGGGGVFCLGSSPVFRSCTISGNKAGYNDSLFRGAGGGVDCNGSTPSFVDCWISDNRAGLGGGFYCFGSFPVLTNCTIANNVAKYFGFSSNVGTGGGIASFISSPFLNGCTVRDNTAEIEGGGLACFNSPSPILIGCSVLRNSGLQGGGVNSGSLSTPILERCAISENSAVHGGGIACFGSSPTIANCLISRNVAAQSGGAVHCSNEASPELASCMILENTSGATGGGLSASSSTVVLKNCDLLNNVAIDGSGLSSGSSMLRLINCVLVNPGDQVHNVNGLPPTISHSCVAGGGQLGVGNISEDPVFVNPSESDFRLMPDSPCIDSGSNEAVLKLGPAILALGDLDQNVRIWDGDGDGIARVDMGAYEFGSTLSPGDLNGSASVDMFDLFVALHFWHEETSFAPLPGDQNGDSEFTADDLLILEHALRNHSP
ncbi:MAG: right-handed parallel beta-helix repeat-containing protein [Candidatus Omnitrophica bacterium]|nr:right-handed parallel beta-helix repeat-containing protein [Candidatus Omnitrophota bacterium]